MPNITEYGSYVDSGTWDSPAGTVGTAGSGSSNGVMPSSQGVAGVVGAVGSAVGDIFTAQADQRSAAQYDAAAQIALQNKNIVAGSLLVQTAQAQRTFNLSQGAQTAEIGAAGFNGATSSTAQALRTSGANQFAVNMNQITGNNFVQQQAYQSQATDDQNAAKSAMASSGMANLGAAFSTVSAIAQVAAMA